MRPDHRPGLPGDIDPKNIHVPQPGHPEGDGTGFEHDPAATADPGTRHWAACRLALLAGGDLPPEEEKAVRRIALRDPELARTLEQLEGAVGILHAARASEAEAEAERNARRLASSRARIEHHRDEDDLDARDIQPGPGTSSGDASVWTDLQRRIADQRTMGAVRPPATTPVILARATLIGLALAAGLLLTVRGIRTILQERVVPGVANEIAPPLAETNPVDDDSPVERGTVPGDTPSDPVPEPPAIADTEVEAPRLSDDPANEKLADRGPIEETGAVEPGPVADPEPSIDTSVDPSGSAVQYGGGRPMNSTDYLGVY